ncbi:MAG TPA: hypothetical protein PK466_05505 [Thermotogota bacterium]|nr:hypothetical protein [Thermotogota bacterium]HPJ89552.1 hypothetical protein [Thermotogota bacterium]HPR95763.1 hypothetical protein [Thermotogota bacterium]
MRLFFGLTLLLIGLLIVFGIFDASIFGTMVENLFFLWPFILIMIGISILSNIKGLRWLKIVNVFCIIAFTLALMFYPTDYYNASEYQEFPFQIAIASPEVKTILELELGTVYLEIDTDYELSNMISGVYVSDENDLEVDHSANRIKLKRENDYQVFAFKKPRHEIHLKVPADAYMELLIDAAVVKGDLNLKTNPFEYVDINTAMLDLDVSLNSINRTLYFKSQSAINTIDFYLPEYTDYYRNVQSAINNFSVREDHINSTETDPDIVVDVHSAISNISLNSNQNE